MITVPGGGLWYPVAPCDKTPASNQLVLDGATEKFGLVFRVPKTGNIQKVGIYFSAVAQDPANGVKVSLQTVGTGDGFPDGTIDQYRVETTIAANTWRTTGIISSDGTDGGALRSVTVDGLLSIVVEFESHVGGDDVDMASVSQPSSVVYGAGSNYPVWYNGSVWTKQSSSIPIQILYDDGEWVSVSPELPASVYRTTKTFNNTDSPNEFGSRLKLPVRMEVSGIYSSIDWDNPGDIILYDADDNVLETGSFDRATGGSGTNFVLPIFRFAPRILEANTLYRLAVKPTTASNLRLVRYVRAAAFGEVSIGGSEWYGTERTVPTPGTWTDLTDESVAFGFLVTAIEGAVSPAGLHLGVM